MSEQNSFEVMLTTLAYGGDCLGRLPQDSARPGLAVFVPYALPGERVRVRLVEEKRGHARAELLEVLEPSPERITPRCPHFGPPLSPHRRPPDSSPSTNQQWRRWGDERGVGCGGCHYQHMPYEAQLRAKEAILRDQLVRIGGIADPPVRPIIPSPDPWNYRNHIQFHLTPEGRLGFEAARTNTVIPISECHLPEAAINELWPQLDLEAIPGLERVGLRVGADDELMLTLESAEALDFTVEDLPISAVQLGPGGAMVLAGSDYLVMEVLGRPFRVSAGSFFQVNTPMAAAMVEHLLANLPLSPSVTALDLYCGVGLFSAFLAPRVGRLIGVEASPSACEDFAVNLDACDNVELYEASVEATVVEATSVEATSVEATLVEAVLPGPGIHPQVIVLDPPRAGVDRRALEAIVSLGASAIAYVSCDPSTLGRDARRLIEGGYRLRQVTPFDLFPQTYHIESISFWEK